MIGQLFVLSPLIAGNVVAIWLWLRAEDRVYRAERERDDLWDACTCDATHVTPPTEATP